MCDRKAKAVHNNIENRPERSNIKYSGCYEMKHKDIRITRSIKEGFQIIDAEKEERDYMKQKFLYHYEFIDFDARNAFTSGSITTAMIKCTYGFNQYASRDKIINYRATVDECPRCSCFES